MPIGDAVNPNVACVTTFMCAPTRRRPSRAARRGRTSSATPSAHYYLFGQHRPGATDVWAEFEERRAQHGLSTPRRSARPPGTPSASVRRRCSRRPAGLRGAVGTPEQIREYLRRYEELGVDQVIFVSQAGRNRHERHHGEPRAVRHGRSCPSSPSATRSSAPKRRPGSPRSSKR